VPSRYQDIWSLGYFNSEVMDIWVPFCSFRFVVKVGTPEVENPTFQIHRRVHFRCTIWLRLNKVSRMVRRAWSIMCVEMEIGDGARAVPRKVCGHLSRCKAEMSLVFAIRWLEGGFVRARLHAEAIVRGCFQRCPGLICRWYAPSLLVSVLLLFAPFKASKNGN